MIGHITGVDFSQGTMWCDTNLLDIAIGGSSRVVMPLLRI